MLASQTPLLSEVQGQLFDPTLIDTGHWAQGLPDSVTYIATHIARVSLFTQPRFSRQVGYSEDDREIIFDPRTNTWTDWRGAMCWTMTATDIALSAATKYLRHHLGVNEPRFSEELQQIATTVARQYEQYHEPRRQMVGVANG